MVGGRLVEEGWNRIAVGVDHGLSVGSNDAARIVAANVVLKVVTGFDPGLGRFEIHEKVLPARVDVETDVEPLKAIMTGSPDQEKAHRVGQVAVVTRAPLNVLRGHLQILTRLGPFPVVAQDRSAESVRVPP